MGKRFAHRWICVTETTYVVKPNSFSYRSYAHYGDASAAVDAINGRRSLFKRAYLVDRDNDPDVLLPRKNAAPPMC
jgi:hypothetical protein